MDDKSKNLALGHLDRARDFLNLGQLVLANGYNAAAVSQGYFAVHHGVAAALFAQGKRPRSHAEFVTLFGTVLVPSGKFSEEDGSTFEDFLEQRKKADYAPVDLYDAPFAMKALEVAGEMVLRLDAYVRELIDAAEAAPAAGPAETAEPAVAAAADPPAADPPAVAEAAEPPGEA